MMSGLLNSGLNGSNSNLQEAAGRAFPAQSGSTSAVLNHSGGNIQGLHGIHGNFNTSTNMPGTFASRNSTMIAGPLGGVQQVPGNASSGRFTINNLPAALSQLSLANSHGHSGVANNGGSGALPNLGNSGRVANPMANYVSGGNTARGLSSGGGSNLPGVASRLNLADPQVVSMLGGSYSTAGVPLSRNQFQAGNGPYTSLLLNDLNAHEDTAFDINDFPQLGGRPSSSSGSQGQMGFLRKNVGFGQQNQEFSIQNEDFPALPGYKGGSVEFPMNIHQKEQLHNMSSMMHPQNMPLGRSSGMNFGGASSSHYQQPQQHVSSTNGSGLSFVPANYQNYQDLHFHDPEARSIGQPVSGSGPTNSSNAGPGMGPYEQLPQQYQQFQKQSYFRVGTPFRDQDVKPMQAPQAPADKFGMLGLLNIIKMVNPALTSLALGIDLTTLGLNLNSSESIHKKFASPWSEEPAKGEPEYNIPECYYATQPPALKQSYFSKFRPETLFYIFYSMPKDEAQIFAATELYNRGWFYHRDLRLWFAKAKNMEPLVKTPTYERGCYFCFDPNTWETVRKDNFVLQYDMIEKRPAIQPAVA